MIEIEQLSKTFRAVAAVKDLSFKAPNGAITGLLGSNGAGKTTTLKMIAGVLKPEAGRIRMDDGLGALLDHTGLYPRLTGRENLAYFAELRGIPRPRIKERVEEVIALLGLEAVADRPTARFSQGEHMKTALGRAIIHAPVNLILDEPTNGLDVPTVRSLRSLLKRMRDGGACVIFSSHVLEEVRALCDNVVVIAKGALVAQGTPQELCQRTATKTLEEAFVRLTATEEAIAC